MNVNITTKHYEVSDELRRYIDKKVDKLNRFIPRHARKTAHMDIVLRGVDGKSTNPYQCEFILHLPQEEIVAKEATINMFAAVDIVEAKVKHQLLKYKDKATEHDAWRSRVWRRLRMRGEL